LTSIVIPQSVTSIEHGAFEYCTGLDTIFSNATTPPVIDEETFEDVNRNIPVIVPCGSVSAYKNAGYWYRFTNIQHDSDCTGVEENEIADLQIFPNPVSNTLNITSSEQILSIEIVNVIGQVVYRTEVNGNNAVCDVKDLKSGVYVVMISTLSMSKGAVVEQRKFIKE
jgi:hypothetical protein